LAGRDAMDRAGRRLCWRNIADDHVVPPHEYVQSSSEDTTQSSGAHEVEAGDPPSLDRTPTTRLHMSDFLGASEHCSNAISGRNA
jgi:hypothetical protein